MLTDRQLFFRHLAQTSPEPLNLEVESASGCYLTDKEGKRYLDLISGISVSNTGHRHPAVTEAIKLQLDRYLHVMVYGEYIQSPQVKFAGKLASLLPPSLDSIYFVNSGSEAVEGALKLAKRYTGRSGIVAFRNAYHGSTHGSLSVMGDDRLRIPFYPLLPGVSHLEYNSIEDLEQITRQTGCVIIEPVQGEAGVIAARPEFLTALRKKCTANGTLLIFDEIQTGFGRTGSLFAFERHGVVPDILLLAKAMGGGLPLGAFISSQVIMSCISHDPALGHITTFGGNALCCAAGLASLQVILDEQLAGSVPLKSAQFRQRLANLKGVVDYRSAGLLIAIELQSYEKVKKVISKCLRQGIITDWFLFNDHSIRLAPPLIIGEQDITMACDVITQAITESDK